MRKTRLAIELSALLLTGLFVSPGSASEPTDSSASMMVSGIRRTFLAHLPLNHNRATSFPLLIVLHGGGGTGKGMVRLTSGEFNKLSDAEGFIVVYPDGIDKHWNDARSGDESRDSAHEEKVDDIGFIASLIDTLVVSRHADPQRVYVTGISNGAIMSYRLACEISNKITAIAAVDGGIPVNGLSHCSPGNAVSVLVMNGTKDPLVHWEGGEVTGPFGFKKLGRLLSVKETVEFWVKHDRCTAAPDSTMEPDRDPDDGTRVTKTGYKGGDDETEVVLFTVKGGGHTWPGGRQYLPAWIVGRTSRDIDACQVIWEFFRTKKRP